MRKDALAVSSLLYSVLPKVCVPAGVLGFCAGDYGGGGGARGDMEAGGQPSYSYRYRHSSTGGGAGTGGGQARNQYGRNTLREGVKKHIHIHTIYSIYPYSLGSKRLLDPGPDSDPGSRLFIYISYILAWS